MRFDRLGWVQVVGVAANLGVMLLLLFHGGSYWSVVAGSLAGVAASTITVRLLGGGGDVRPQWDREEARKILAYGKHLVAAGLLLFLINNADNWIVGKMEGLAVLGLYGMAFRWGNGFVRDFASVVGRVLFPTLTRLREDRARLGAAFVECLTFMALLSTPACLGMLAVAPVLVRDLLGEVWVPCTFALQLWCVYGACRSLGMVNGALLTAAGRPDRIARTSTIFLVVSVLPAFAATWLWGMNGMTCVYVATGFLSLWLALRYSLELLPVGWFEVWCAVRGPVVLSTGMAGVVHLALRCLPGGGLSVLFLSVLVGVVVYAALVASFQRKEVGRLVDLVREGWRRRGEAAA